ncbi:hypothetical protein EG329_003076 [Mollisiaceae sp. DMI_Dod_QoI]|nr:hypothetical protein EG329_003076 [Helotiales sp. DMI_Dod_QoI]
MDNPPPTTALPDLLTLLHTNIASIQSCLTTLSDPTPHTAALSTLTSTHTSQLQQLRTTHSLSLKSLTTQRAIQAVQLATTLKAEAEEIEESRKREYAAFIARCKREDEARQARLAAEEEERERIKREEDEERERVRAEEEGRLKEQAEREVEKLEKEMERKVEEGRRELAELDGRRKEINGWIDRVLDLGRVGPGIEFGRAKRIDRVPKEDVIAEPMVENEVVKSAEMKSGEEDKDLTGQEDRNLDEFPTNNNSTDSRPEVEEIPTEIESKSVGVVETEPVQPQHSSNSENTDPDELVLGTTSDSESQNKEIVAEPEAKSAEENNDIPKEKDAGTEAHHVADIEQMTTDTSQETALVPDQAATPLEVNNKDAKPDSANSLPTENKHDDQKEKYTENEQEDESEKDVPKISSESHDKEQQHFKHSTHDKDNGAPSLDKSMDGHSSAKDEEHHNSPETASVSHDQDTAKDEPVTERGAFHEDTSTNPPKARDLSTERQEHDESSTEHNERPDTLEHVSNEVSAPTNLDLALATENEAERDVAHEAQVEDRHQSIDTSSAVPETEELQEDKNNEHDNELKDAEHTPGIGHELRSVCASESGGELKSELGDTLDVKEVGDSEEPSVGIQDRHAQVPEVQEQESKEELHEKTLSESGNDTASISEDLATSEPREDLSKAVTALAVAPDSPISSHSAPHAGLLESVKDEDEKSSSGLDGSVHVSEESLETNENSHSEVSLQELEADKPLPSEISAEEIKEHDPDSVVEQGPSTLSTPVKVQQHSVSEAEHGPKSPEAVEIVSTLNVPAHDAAILRDDASSHEHAESIAQSLLENHIEDDHHSDEQNYTEIHEEQTPDPHPTAEEQEPGHEKVSLNSSNKETSAQINPDLIVPQEGNVSADGTPLETPISTGDEFFTPMSINETKDTEHSQNPSPDQSRSQEPTPTFPKMNPPEDERSSEGLDLTQKNGVLASPGVDSSGEHISIDPHVHQPVDTSGTFDDQDTSQPMTASSSYADTWVSAQEEQEHEDHAEPHEDRSGLHLTTNIPATRDQDLTADNYLPVHTIGSEAAITNPSDHETQERPLSGPLGLGVATMHHSTEVDREPTSPDAHVPAQPTHEDEHQRAINNIAIQPGFTPLEHPDSEVDEYMTEPVQPRTPVQVPAHFSENHAESPATVLNADDLFAEDSDEEPPPLSHYQDASTEKTSETRPSDPELQTDDIANQYFEEARVVHPVPEHPPINQLEETQRGSSSLFANLVDTIRPDISLVRQMRDRVDDQSEEHSQASNRPQSVSFDDSVGPYHEYPHESTLHIRTHTADTVPSFDSYARSDTPSSPSEVASSPFQETPHDEPRIQSSWHDDSPAEDEHRDLKPGASPLQPDFDTFNSTANPNYVTPKTSEANMRENYDPFDDSGVDAPKLPIRHLSPSPSPRRPTSNTPDTSQFPESRPNDSPVSAMRSLHEEPSSPFPPPSSLARRPTSGFVIPKVSSSRTSISSPSIPGNSFFQKTRSLFESGAAQPASPSPRPLSGFFSSGRSTPLTPPRKTSRRSSLHQTEPPAEYNEEDDGEVLIRNLDGNGRPPSPVFIPTSSPANSHSNSGSISSIRKSIPRNDDDVVLGHSHRASNPFLGGLSRLVGAGSGGLEDTSGDGSASPDEKRLIKPGFEFSLEKIDEVDEIEFIELEENNKDERVVTWVSNIVRTGFDPNTSNLDDECAVNHRHTKVTNIVRVGFDGDAWELTQGQENHEPILRGDVKEAWLWVEGWRARLRAGGDLVEKCRYGYKR